MNKQTLQYIVSIILSPILAIIAININDLIFIPATIKFSIVFCIFSFSAIAMFFLIKKIMLPCKMFLSLNTALSFVFLIYSILDKHDLLQYFTSVTTIKELIFSTGALGVLVFIFIQTAQVVFLPIPAVMIVLVGLMIFGPWLCALYCSIGVVIGSNISFLVGKTFGYKFVSWVIGEKNLQKYMSIVGDNGKIVLAFTFVFPFFPDDVLCLIAGISPMSFKDFFIVSAITRPIGIFFLCLFGGGYIIPFNTPLGIFMWVLVLCILIISCIVFIKNQNKIKQLFYDTNPRKTKFSNKTK